MVVKIETMDQIIATDPCLDGCGGMFGDRFYYATFPDFMASSNIAHLKYLVLVIIACVCPLNVICSHNYKTH